MSRIDHGFVDIELGGETITLKPTLNAMLAINRKFGNLRKAIEQVEELDFDAVSFILSVASDRKDVSEQLFNSGFINLVGPTANYLVNLMNPSGRNSDSKNNSENEGKV